MLFEWDEAKSARNRKKHGMSFDEAARMFKGAYLSRIDTREDYGEIREITIGMIAEEVVTVVVHTDRAEAIRIISARKANKRERSAYHVYCTQEAGRSATDFSGTD